VDLVVWACFGGPACNSGACPVSTIFEYLSPPLACLKFSSERIRPDFVLCACRGKNVLTFSIIHQQRIFALKKELPKGESILGVQARATQKSVETGAKTWAFHV
jgi:hypothetical protein